MTHSHGAESYAHGHDDEGHGHSHTHDHDHDHDQDHDHPHRGGLVGQWLSEIFGGHSHDAADRVDNELETNADGRRALWISLGVLVATALVQGIVVWISGSVALLGDTLHNVADALTAFPLMVAFRLALRPANKRYTYGYGRAEDLAGLFVVLMMLVAAVVAAWEAIDRLLHPQDVQYLWAVAAAALTGFIGNEIVARYRITVGRRIGSAALVADGLHARTDGFTSLAVLVGAGGVALGWRWADPVVGLLITVAILGVLRSAVAQVGARLMDAVDPGLVDQAVASVAGCRDVVAVDSLRIRWIGHALHAEVDISLAPETSFRDAHGIAHHAEEHLLSDVRRLRSAQVHVSPQGEHP